MSILNRGHARHGVVIPKIAPISGRYYGIRSAYPASATTVAITANVLTAAPFFAPVSFVANQIALNMTVAASAGKLARLGLYTANPTTGLPDALVADSGALALDTAAPAVLAATLSPTVAIAAGLLYWLTYLGNATATVACLNGSVAVLGLAAASDTTPLLAVYRSLTYAALPATWGTLDGYTPSAINVLLRAA